MNTVKEIQNQNPVPNERSPTGRRPTINQFYKLRPVYSISVSQFTYLENGDIASFLLRVVREKKCSCFISHSHLTPSCYSTSQQCPHFLYVSTAHFVSLSNSPPFIYIAHFTFNIPKALWETATSEMKGHNIVTMYSSTSMELMI